MIWCVEDDASIRDIEVYALQSTGFEARGFEDGTSFWDALQGAALPELAALAEGDWEGALITQPVPVSRMHALMAQALGQDGESFFAALQ